MAENFYADQVLKALSEQNQENKGEELANIMVEFIANNPR